MDLLEGDVELTEFEAIEVESIKGVGKGANGFPILMMKGLAGAAETSPPAAEVPAGRPAWHAAAAALARMGAKVADVDPGILYKAVNAAGEVDEAPDIDGGKKAIALVAKLIGYEAAELEAGCLDEICDIGLLLSAADALRCWLSNERSNAMVTADTDQMAGKSEAAPVGDVTYVLTTPAPSLPNGGAGGISVKAAGLQHTGPDEEPSWLYAADEVAKDSRTFTAAERKKHAASGTALPDGSYPIPDKDALRRAAILARSGHGDVKAARALIARRARELGVPNPLDTDDKASDSDSAKAAAVAEGATAVDTEAIDQAVAKALASSEERFTALEGELAKANATIGEMASRPVHGGPVLSAAAHHRAPAAGTDDWAAKAAYYRQQAEEVTDRQSADGYRQLAREADDKARAVTPG